jgi:carbamate kinase
VVALTAVVGVLRASARAGANAPFSDAVNAMFGGTAGGDIIAGVVVISGFGALNGWTLIVAEMPRAAAKDGLFPARFETVNRRGVPAFGIVVSTALASLAIVINYLGSSGVTVFTTLVLMTGITSAVPYLLSALAQIRWRVLDRREMETPRFARDIVVAGLAAVFSVLFIWYSRNTGHGFWVYWAPFLLTGAAFALAVPVYRMQGAGTAGPDPAPVIPVSSPAPGAPGRRAVVALGGNALLRRGEPLEAATQAKAADAAARALAGASTRHQLVITHGNGPQVGLLALTADAAGGRAPYPLDVLDAETEGQIGYVLELALDNAIDHQDTVAVLTRVVVDELDPAFTTPAKFIGPVYSEAEARSRADRYGWAVARDGDRWRRVVASPQPRRIVQLAAIDRLVAAGFLVVCAGGGGVPVVEDADGSHRGVEAVVDKDLTAALLAVALGAETLVLATDVDAVYDDYGTPSQRAIVRATPADLRAREFTAGSMGPKVEAVCRFVERTGGHAVIGRLDQIDDLLDGRAGTHVVPGGSALQHDQLGERHVHAA